MRLLPFLLLCCPVAAFAEGEPSISFALGLGAQSSPGYFGADTNAVGPTGSFALGALSLGPVTLGGGDADDGFGPRGSFRIVSSRAAADFPELAGMTDLDLAVEVGGGVQYSAPNFDVFADLRYGVIGHESMVAEVGGDVIYRATDQLTFRAGPRLFWGSDDYAQTYFGVTSAESEVSSFAAFDARGGWLSQGVKAQATYQITDDWGVTGTLRYDQLRDDAADSPITQTTDQVSASVVITRKVAFRF